MNTHCTDCGVKYEREPGFFLGAIYFNYGLTALVVIIAYPALKFTGTLDGPLLQILSLGFVVLFPLWFHRYARSLWLGFDEYIDPREKENQ